MSKMKVFEEGDFNVGQMVPFLFERVDKKIIAVYKIDFKTNWLIIHLMMKFYTCSK